MTWIRKSPFSRLEDPIEHMLMLLSREADNVGTPLSDVEKKILAMEVVPERPVPEDLRVRVKQLISNILERERTTDLRTDAKSFLSSLEWVEPDYPNIAALAEEVITSGGFGALPPLRGKRWIQDRVQLLGCAIILVLVLMTIAVAIGFLFDRK